MGEVQRDVMRLRGGGAVRTMGSELCRPDREVGVSDTSGVFERREAEGEKRGMLLLGVW
jgi:hypothetical protein